MRFGRLRGFVPQSQMSMERRRELTGETPEDRRGSMVNEPIVVKVMEVICARNRRSCRSGWWCGSRARNAKYRRSGELEVGEAARGSRGQPGDFGAFIYIGGAEGLGHLTEMSWQQITHPREALDVGQTVRVEVISIDKDKKRIGLSTKREAPFTWTPSLSITAWDSWCKNR